MSESARETAPGKSLLGLPIRIPCLANRPAPRYLRQHGVTFEINTAPFAEILAGLEARMPHVGAQLLRGEGLARGIARAIRGDGAEPPPRMIRGDGAELPPRPFFEVQTYEAPGWAVFDEAAQAAFEHHRRRVEAEILRGMMLPNALLAIPPGTDVVEADTEVFGPGDRLPIGTVVRIDRGEDSVTAIIQPAEDTDDD